MCDIPVITVDGPAGSGKGTLAKKVAEHLGFYYLDSGLLYRGLALWVLEEGVPIQEPERIVTFLRPDLLEIQEDREKKHIVVYYQGQDVRLAGQSESIAQIASKVAAIAGIREYLLNYQKEAKRLPGLVADGRDMGSMVFPEAMVKFYLEASLEIRAKRRWKQLKAGGSHVSLGAVREAMAMRDLRDSSRAIAPAQCTSSMVRIDSSALTIPETFSRMQGELLQQLK